MKVVLTTCPFHCLQTQLQSPLSGVVRFFRQLLAKKDEQYFELIIQGNLFNPIVQALKSNNGRYNLLDSAILEMFEFIQHENLITLMDHILTNFGPELDTIDYVNTFKLMRQKKEAIHEGIGEGSLLKSDRSSIEKYVSHENNNDIFEELDNDDNSHQHGSYSQLTMKRSILNHYKKRKLTHQSSSFNHDINYDHQSSSQMYLGNHSRREMDSIWLQSSEGDVEDVNDVDTDPDSNNIEAEEIDPDKEIDPDSDPDATVGSEDNDGLNLPELEFTMDGSKQDDDEHEDEDIDEEVEEEDDDIQLDEEDCTIDELEPQFKKKKTK